MLRRDVDYVLHNREVLTVDEYRGRIVREGSFAEVKADPRVIESYLGDVAIC